MPTIEIDKSALRFGGKCGGWIVILEWVEDGLTDECNKTFGAFNVCNKIFDSEDSAVEYSNTVSDCFKCTIKALRSGPLIRNTERTV